MSLTIRTVDVGQDYITASVTTSGSVAMQHNWYIDGELYDTIQTDAGETTSRCTFEDLYPDTSYTIRVAAYGFNPWRLLDEGSKTITTDEAPLVSNIYYGRVVLYGNGGRTSSGAQYINFDGWSGASWDDYADIEIDFDGSDFLRSGYKLVGFATSSSATSARYDVEDSITITATSTDYDDPTVRTLYAVWVEEIGRPPNWVWVSTVSTGAEVRTVRQTDGTYHAYYLTAAEWLAFIERIQEFANYLDESLSSARISQATTGVVAGYGMTAVQANGAQLLIASLSPPKDPPSIIDEGDAITATFINGLKDSLNSIP